VKDVILDVDTGIDDALALMVAAWRTDDFRILGTTTVAGNVDLKTATDNTRAVLGLIGRADVPVAIGAARPLIRALQIAPAFHGILGMGTIDVADWDVPRAPLADASAAEFIARTARERPGQVTLIATGPLTNVALALAMDRSLANRLAEIVIMGGAIAVPGNASPVAEANFHNDPEAARIVLASGARILLVPLDVTEQVAVDRARLRQLRGAAKNLPSATANVSVELLEFYLKAYEEHGRIACALHDPLAVLLAGRPDLTETADHAIEIATADPATAGLCIVDRRPPTALRSLPQPNVRLSTRVDIETCRELIVEAFWVGG
jgi:purine nucleosidase